MPHLVDPARERRRREGRRRRRRTLLVVIAAVAGAAALAGVLAARPWQSSSRPQPTRAAAPRTPVRARARPVALHPPGPIPGYLLIADRGNDRMLLVDSAHHVFWQYPKPGAQVPMPFRFDDDTFFGPKLDRIISNQEDQNTIQIISFPGGKILWRYGHVNQSGTAPGYLHTPDDAYLLRNGLVSVADAYNCRVLFISPAHRIVREYGRAGVCGHEPPRMLGSVNGATPLPDGGTLVSEINGSWVDDIGPTGRLRWAVRAPVRYPSDPQLLAPDRILLADYSKPGAAVIITRTGRVVWRYSPSSGEGELNHPSLATRIAPGLIAINDDYRHRVVLVSMRTHRIVWQYGHTDSAGAGPGYLNTPDGMDLLPTAAAQRLPVLRALLSHVPVEHAPPVAIAAAPYRLPAPVERAAAAVSGGRVLVAGGLDAGGSSSSGVYSLDPASGRLTSLGRLPEPVHDAAAAVLAGRLLVFGGGASSSSSSVQALDLATRRTAVVGRLPRPLSDLASAAVGGRVYLVGGYDDHAPRPEILATADGRTFRVAGRLPVGLRYPAVAVAGRDVLVAGGTGPGGPVATVLRFDPATGRVRLVARLPRPVAHAAAVVLGTTLVVIGGRDAGGHVVADATAIDLRTGRVTPLAAGAAIADAAVARLPSRALLVGGAHDSGPTAAILVVRPR